MKRNFEIRNILNLWYFAILQRGAYSHLMRYAETGILSRESLAKEDFSAVLFGLALLLLSASTHVANTQL